MYIDYSVYPDLDDPPEALETDEDRADYVQRICAAWDFHIHPEPETFALFSQWKDIFDRFPLVMSPATRSACGSAGSRSPSRPTCRRPRPTTCTSTAWKTARPIRARR